MDLAAGPVSHWSTGDAQAAMGSVVATKGLAVLASFLALEHFCRGEMKGSEIACLLLCPACSAGHPQAKSLATARVRGLINAAHRGGLGLGGVSLTIGVGGSKRYCVDVAAAAADDDDDGDDDDWLGRR